MKCLLLLLALCACGTQASPLTAYELAFEAVDDRGDPLADVELSVGTTRIGSTSSRGALRAQVNATDGDRFPLHAPCPASYEPADIPDDVVFRDTKGLEGQERTVIELRIVCARRDRVVALLVHADGHEGMPVLIDGVAHGRTGPGGFAHLRLELKPNAQFQVSLDSSSRPSLRPQTPRRSMTVGAQDDLFIFDPVFTEVPPPKRPRRRRRRRRRQNKAPDAHKRPIRID